MTRDLICSSGRFGDLCLETEPGTSDGEWYADDEPHEDEEEHCAEGNSTGCFAGPDEEVQKEEDGENQTWKSNGCVGKVLLPCISAEESVDAGRNIASDKAEECVEDDHDGPQESTT